MNIYRETATNLNDICDVCQSECYAYSICNTPLSKKSALPISHSSAFKHPYIRVCFHCMNTLPCGTCDNWWDGQNTCPHGYIYEKDVDWLDVGVKAKINWRIVGRTWKRRLIDRYRDWFWRPDFENIVKHSQFSIIDIKF